MDESRFFDILLRSWFALAVVMFVVLMVRPAPYGRHATLGWGPTVSARPGWLLMEAPASLLFLLWFLAGARSGSVVLVVFLLMWEAHYVHRAFLYPFTLGSTARRIPVLVVLFGVFFNVANTYLNGRYLFSFTAGYGVSGFPAGVSWLGRCFLRWGMRSTDTRTWHCAVRESRRDAATVGLNAASFATSAARTISGRY